MRFPCVLAPGCRFKVRVIGICLCWYVISSASSITNKVLLQSYPYPITLALSNLMWVPIYSIPLLRIWERKFVQLTSTQYSKYLTPISAGKALAVVSAYFSLWKVPVSYAHTVKASMPLFAVLLSRILLKEKQTYKVYMSLLPIVAGVVIASATELSFSFAGMLSALFSTFTYSLLNILVKKLLKESEIHPIRLLAMNSQLAAIMVFPFWLFNDALAMTRSFGSSGATSPSPDLWMLCLLAMTGVLSFMQSVCAFSLIHELTALSYAVCNATKRITVIGSSLFTLHNPVTVVNASTDGVKTAKSWIRCRGLLSCQVTGRPLIQDSAVLASSANTLIIEKNRANVFGMILSIMGVFCYNRAKQAEKLASHSLPFTRSHTVLSESTLVALDSAQDNDLMYWASSNRPSLNGSRLGDLGYSNNYQYDKLDDISKEQHNRRHVRFA